MKKHMTTILLIAVFLVGLSMLLYPTVSDYWNSFHQSHAIAEYAESVNLLDDSERNALLEKAREYNERLLTKENRWFLSEDEELEYDSMLKTSASGIMGYIEIPKINCSLPIYHSTDESVLQTAIGHIEGSSLPIGGESTHCVLSGHRGLPSAKLFTNLDRLTEGDIFMLDVLGETYTYEVVQILIVEPDDLSALEIKKGEDLCTLVTCTPYGVNTHRLLVTGQRTENQANINVVSDAQQIKPMLVAPIIAAPIMLVLFIYMMIKSKRNKNKPDVKELIEKTTKDKKKDGGSAK